MKKLASVALCGVIGIIVFVFWGVLGFVIDKRTDNTYHTPSEIYGEFLICAILGSAVGSLVGGIIAIFRSHRKK